VTKQYRRHDDIRLTAMEGEGVVLHMGERRYFTVTETGLVILEALKTPRTFDELVGAITDEYDVTTEHAGRSVQAFLDQCLKSSLVLESQR
jgi:Coenzyme PQQ synthesis protein D (PqqD)